MHVIGWWVAPRYRRWQERSSHEQVEASTRWMLSAYTWLILLAFVPQLVARTGPGALPAALAWSVFGIGLAQCLLCTGMLRQAVDGYMGAAAVGRGRLVLPAVLFAAMSVLIVTLFALGAVDEGAVGMALYGTVAPFAVVFGVTVRRRTTALAFTAVVAVMTATLAAVGMGWRALPLTALELVLGGVISVFTARSSAWYIAVIRELDKARGVQARLAVAEERLRFSRDLHDVMGRNLSAIALKSELAAQLVRRGLPADAAPAEAASAHASVEQMTEVQRIARESQSEVRAVVRGYREADLSTELAGARGILRAAGVDCRTESDEGHLPGSVQAALGWVVREGATNVLRHADATWCTVRVGADASGGKALLVMENDGVRDPARTSGGSGLAGLRERLAGLGGTLDVAAARGGNTFRLTAEVPLAGHGGGDGDSSGDSGGADTGTAGTDPGGKDAAR